jgi:D-3-phosphoglycerate dehydrogenase
MAYRILIADPLAEAGLAILRDSGAELHQLEADERPRLAELIADYDAIVVRSATRVTAELLAAGDRLRVVARAGIGVDNVDVAAATERGILVVNAPTANLISATEHTFGLLLALARNIPAATASVRAGEWERKRFQGHELMGKTLGVVGLGRIGQAVAARARAFEMRVLAHDPYLDAAVGRRLDIEMLPLDELLSEVDVVTLHLPLSDGTRNLIDARRLALMKPGALLVNCARGGVVDDAALLEAIEEGRLAGAALDVFAQEPPADLSLAAHPRVVATPHIGAQTREAQERVATQTARMLLAALGGSLEVTAVNLPFGATTAEENRFLRLAERLGRLAAEALDGGFRRLEVGLWGLAEEQGLPLTVAALKGALGSHLGDGVNYVNAEAVAASRGIEVVRAIHHGGGDYSRLVGINLAGAAGTVELAGTLFGESDARVVRFEGYRLEFRPEGLMLLLQNLDVPGVVGKLGATLGEAGVNIADIHLARESQGEEAVAVLRLDNAPPPELLEKLRGLEEVIRVRLVDLGVA